MFNIKRNKFTDFITDKNPAGLPAVPIIAGDHAAYISKIPLSRVLRSGKDLAAALIGAFEIYRQDAVFVFSDVTVEAEAMGVELDYPENELPKIKDHPKIEKITPGDPLKDGRMPEILEAGRICVNELGGNSQVFIVIKDPFSLAVLLRDPEEFLKDCIKDPERNHRILGLALENQVNFLEEVINTGAIPLIGAPYSSGSLISPAFFSEFVSPYLKKMFETIRAEKKPSCMHICGDTEVIFKEIIDLKPDVLSIDEMDIPKYSQMAFGSTLLMGNLSTTLLLNGKPDEIYDKTTDLIGSSDHPFIPSTSCDVPMKTPRENVDAMLSAVRDIRSGNLKSTL